MLSVVDAVLQNSIRYLEQKYIHSMFHNPRLDIGLWMYSILKLSVHGDHVVIILFFCTNISRMMTH